MKKFSNFEICSITSWKPSSPKRLDRFLLSLWTFSLTQNHSPWGGCLGWWMALILLQNKPLLKFWKVKAVLCMRTKGVYGWGKFFGVEHFSVGNILGWGTFTGGEHFTGGDLFNLHDYVLNLDLFPVAIFWVALCLAQNKHQNHLRVGSHLGYKNQALRGEL